MLPLLLRPARPARRSPTPVADIQSGLVVRGARIRCPRCAWQPRRSDRWQCHCGCVWNTFETGARCPQCGHQWQETQCLACLQLSPHLAWYERGEAKPG